MICAFVQSIKTYIMYLSGIFLQSSVVLNCSSSGDLSMLASGMLGTEISNYSCINKYNNTKVNKKKQDKLQIKTILS